MHELVDNMMLHAKSRLGGGISISAKPASDLNEPLINVIEEIRISAPDRIIDLELAFNQPISCDPARISQAVSNLVSNAINYGTPDAPVTVRGGCSDTEFTISVSNQGEPIPEDLQKTLFQPFQRGGKEESLGLGLGLHIAFSIAQAHGGNLSVHCENRITTFTLSLPLLATA